MASPNFLNFRKSNDGCFVSVRHLILSKAETYSFVCIHQQNIVYRADNRFLDQQITDLNLCTFVIFQQKNKRKIRIHSLEIQFS